MSEWIETTLGEISTQRKGINYKSEDYCPDDSGHPFITIKCFQKGGGYEPTGIKFYDGGSTKADHLNPGDILFSVTDLTRAGDIVGSPLRVPEFGNSAPSLASMDCMRITPIDSKCAKPFLYHRLMLSDVRRQMVAYAAGSTVLHLDTKKVPAIRVRIPANVAAQRKIATILSTIDTAIEQTEALIEKYQHIKAGLMHDLFTRGVLPNGQLRPPREQAPELHQETAVGWIPKEWQIGQIGNHFEIQLGKMLNQLAKTGRNSFPYLGNRSVQWNRLEMDHLDSMDFSIEEQKKFALKAGDLLVCEGGEVGRTAIWESQMKNCFYQKAIHRLRIKHENIKPRFMLWYMHFAQANGQFADFTSQSSIAHLTQEKLAKVPVLLPSTEEQELIVSRIDAHEFVIHGQRDYLVNLSAQKLGLMQDLLTGKVAVTVDTPPSEAVA
jgi:type I restriction enzyme, S subunit